jgi:hypothetical protein
LLQENSDNNVPHVGFVLRRGLLLEYSTLGWNVVGTIIVVIAAIQS